MRLQNKKPFFIAIIMVFTFVAIIPTQNVSAVSFNAYFRVYSIDLENDGDTFNKGDLYVKYTTSGATSIDLPDAEDQGNWITWSTSQSPIQVKGALYSGYTILIEVRDSDASSPTAPIGNSLWKGYIKIYATTSGYTYFSTQDHDGVAHDTTGNWNIDGNKLYKESAASKSGNYNAIKFQLKVT